MVDVKLFGRFESVCYHCGFCKRLKRQRRDEFTSVVGHNNINVRSEFLSLDTISHALYTAIPPLTPKTTFFRKA